jgi:PPM family protein phosphatase
VSLLSLLVVVALTLTTVGLGIVRWVRARTHVRESLGAAVIRPSIGPPADDADLPALPVLSDQAQDECTHLTIGGTSPDVLQDVRAELARATGPALSRITVSAQGQTMRGARKSNDDAFLIDSARGLYVVADGVSLQGRANPASRLAIEELRARLITIQEDEPALAKHLRQAFEAANARVREFAQSNKALGGMATTLTAALFAPTRASLVVGHVGNSRCYRFRQGTLDTLTTDHAKPRSGGGTALSRAIGARATVDAEVTTYTPVNGDRYLLCTDGLLAAMTEQEIVYAMMGRGPAAARDLVELAHKRNVKDNVSVIVFEVIDMEPAVPAKA